MIKVEINLNYNDLKKLTRFFIGTVCFTLTFSALNAAENPKIKKLEKELKESKERIEILEDSLLDVEEKIGSRAVANAFDGLKLDIGGFIHSAYTYIDGENGSQTSFNRQNFELLISSQLNKQWSAFFAGGFLREADDAFVNNPSEPSFNTKNKNPQIISWVNFRENDLFNIRLGRFITPHGIINIEHFPATLLDPEQPQILRPFNGDTIFPNFSTGIQIHGSTYLNSNHKLQYYTYVSNFSGTPEDEQLGFMIEYNFIKNLTVGFNYSHGKRISNNSYDVKGIHILFNKVNFTWKTEYYATSEDASVISNQDTDRSGGYTQPSLKLSTKWIVFYRYDFLDKFNFSNNRGEKTIENVIGVNYLPYSNVRLRMIYTKKQFDFTDTRLDLDANIFQLSGTFSF